MRHFIYASPVEGDWVYGGPIRDGEPIPYVWGCMVAVFEDDGPDRPAWKQAFFERDRRNLARRVMREKQAPPETPPGVDYPQDPGRPPLPQTREVDIFDDWSATGEDDVPQLRDYPRSRKAKDNLIYWAWAIGLVALVIAARLLTKHFGG